MERARRKLEHIHYAMDLGDGPCSTHFEDFHFLHNCLPELNPADIIISKKILGKHLCLPFFIDAITGGSDQLVAINQALAEAAALVGVGLAVGSQYGAVKTGTGLESYKVIRRYNKHGLVVANMSGLATVAQAQAAVDMLEADGLELHLNPAQELFMPEGDKNFAGILKNLLAIKRAVSVPVIIKETGCGLGSAAYRLLAQEGFTVFNCGGAGGTNFPAIEAARAGQVLKEDFASWGNPTAWTLLEGSLVLNKDQLLIASGGIRTAGQVAKAFALGADAVAVAAPVLPLALENKVGEIGDYFRHLGQGLKDYLHLLGCATPEALRQVPLYITGTTFNYLTCRGYSLSQLCQARR